MTSEQMEAERKEFKEWFGKEMVPRLVPGLKEFGYSYKQFAGQFCWIAWCEARNGK